MAEQHLLSIRLQMEVLITEREGMLAVNMQRVHLGQSMTYTDLDFATVQDRFQHLINILR
mgnify:CR=1 FL=1